MQKYNLVSDLCVRIDKFISIKIPSLSRSYTQKLIDDGFVLVDGVKIKRNFILKENQNIAIIVPEKADLSIGPEDIALEIVYEDECLLIINKQQGLVVHPSAGNPHGTLVNALVRHCGDSLSKVNGHFRPGIVHRLDKDTSGLLIVAKTDFVHTHIQRQFKEHTALRKYIAIVHGGVKNDTGVIDKPIGRHPVLRKKKCVGGENAKDAVTYYKVLERFGKYTFVECTLKTGRTHQIRVHMASVGNPILGDKVYGKKKEKLNLAGQLLHAKTLGFVHPKSMEYMEFDSQIPQRFEKVLHTMGKPWAKKLDKHV
ncbi:MAG: RluA family pseudouridine synthase [Firmicutes bacterium]|nr:RluA family pseudouridine synthase [Bacillota bacterium]